MTWKLAAGTLLFAIALPLAAHHSFDAEFDRNKPVELVGKITKVEWMNPHIWMYLDVTSGGKTEGWQCEGGPPNALRRNGWMPDSLKIGDQVTITGTRSKDGTNTCNAVSVTLASGKKVLAGSSQGDAAAK